MIIATDTVSGIFSDISSLTGSDFETAIVWGYNMGLVYGYSTTRPTKFGPEDSITRAQFVTILYRLAQLEGMAAASSFVGDSSFTDCSQLNGSDFEAAINWASYNGLISGYGDGRFGPEDPITRAQAVAILYRYDQMKNLIAENDIAVTDSVTNSNLSAEDASTASTAETADYSFTDCGKLTGSDFAAAIKWAAGNKYVYGYNDTIFAPEDSITRSQAVAILYRYAY